VSAFYTDACVAFAIGQVVASAAAGSLTVAVFLFPPLTGPFYSTVDSFLCR